MTPRPASPRVSLERALHALDGLAEAEQLSVVELAAFLGIHRSNARRLMRTLERHGLVAPVDGDRGYRLGSGLSRLAWATTAQMTLVRSAHPVVRRLAHATGEQVELTVRLGSSVVCVDHLSALGSRATGPQLSVGHRRSLTGSAEGRTLLEDGPGTPVLTHSESPGIVTVAAPVLDALGAVVAALSLTAPSFRLAAGQLGDEVAPLVRDSAAEITDLLSRFEDESRSGEQIPGWGTRGRP